MSKQIITVAPDGALSGLQRKPGQGLDLRQFGQADIRRASLIEWAEDAQAWYVQPLTQPVLDWAGNSRIDTAAIRRLVDGTGPQVALILDELLPSGWREGRGGVVYANDYDEAVKLEIWFLDRLRLRGIF